MYGLLAKDRPFEVRGARAAIGHLDRNGDARGGAVLSVKAVTGVPVKFIGTGEHLDALQEFHPERMSQRILGMGDILTLVEQAQQKFDQDEMAAQEERLSKGQFTLEEIRIVEDWINSLLSAVE